MKELCRAAHGVTSPAVAALCHQTYSRRPARVTRRANRTGVSLGGVRPPFRFPKDLITLQRAWQQTYAELAQTPTGASTTALRRRLITLSGTLCTHPH